MLFLFLLCWDRICIVTYIRHDLCDVTLLVFNFWYDMLMHIHVVLSRYALSFTWYIRLRWISFCYVNSICVLHFECFFLIRFRYMRVGYDFGIRVNFSTFCCVAFVCYVLCIHFAFLLLMLYFALCLVTHIGFLSQSTRYNSVVLSQLVC